MLTYIHVHVCLKIKNNHSIGTSTFFINVREACTICIFNGVREHEGDIRIEHKTDLYENMY